MNVVKNHGNFVTRKQSLRAAVAGVALLAAGTMVDACKGKEKDYKTVVAGSPLPNVNPISVELATKKDSGAIIPEKSKVRIELVGERAETIEIPLTKVTQKK